MSISHAPQKYAWRTYQVMGDFNPPVFNTLHEVMAAEGGVRLISIQVIQTNTPTNMEEIDIVINVDGNAYVYDSSVTGMLVDNQEYSVFMPTYGVVFFPPYTLDISSIAALSPLMLLASGVLAPDVTPLGKAFEGHDIFVEVRQTSAIAAGARIRCKVTYEVLETV